MCGIVGYLGTKEAYPKLISGLQRLEYRGYDSAGIALLNGSELSIYKEKGKVAALEALCNGNALEGQIGIAHTRWATHGKANQVNAHPHTTQHGNLAMVHNGIIENYQALKKELQTRGHEFISETDSEVLIHLIEEIQINGGYALENAVRLALQRVSGAYAILVMSKNDPEKLVAARKSSPLAIGLGEQEYFVGSDVTPFIEFTNRVIYLNDEEIATIRSSEDCQIRTIEDEVVTPFIQELDLNLDAIEKGDYDSFMLKEIHEQPQAITNSLRGRLNLNDMELSLSAFRDHAEEITKASRIIIVSCGTSWHAGLTAKYWLEEMAEIPVDVEYASEFRYRKPVIFKNDLVIAISQSGETADTLAAIGLAKTKGAFVFSICNVVGSSISRESDAGMYTHAGPEIGVASTKAFTTQLVCLYLFTLELAKELGKITDAFYLENISELAVLNQNIEKVLGTNEYVKSIASTYQSAANFLYLGRGYNFPLALEGALKLKEISYIHAEGYPAAELKHGPIALIDKNMPCLVLANNDENAEKLISNIEEINARDGKVIIVAYEDDHRFERLSEDVIYIPKTNDQLSCIVAAIPLQLLSYHIARMRNCDVDRPRNLAKSVTVE